MYSDMDANKNIDLSFAMQLELCYDTWKDISEECFDM